MIVKENIEISGRAFTKQYSDSGFYIERDGVQYSEAIDPSEFGRTYTETDIPIDIDPTPEPETDIPVEAEATTETEQKAVAFDYLTGRSESGEQVHAGSQSNPREYRRLGGKSDRRDID